jgi:hypothetical protein
MININEFFEKNMGSILYYPGAGNDFETMKLFIDRTTINQIYYVDYSEKIDIDLLLQKLGEDWSILKKEEIIPQEFNQNVWSDFWYDLNTSIEYGNPKEAFGIKITLKNKKEKTCTLFYLGTEAIKTYHILLCNNVKPDLIVLQDHGFGGNWGNQVFGFSESDTKENPARLYGISNVSASLPNFIFVGENTKPWPYYKQLTSFEGKYGSAGHSRALFSIK